jgi:hypothetical protein
MSDFKPFENNTAAWTLPSQEGGEFTAENGKKKIVAAGEIVITRDQAGVKTAEEVILFFQDILAELKKIA